MDFAVLESAEFWTKERSSAAFLQAGFNETKPPSFLFAGLRFFQGTDAFPHPFIR